MKEIIITTPDELRSLIEEAVRSSIQPPQVGHSKEPPDAITGKHALSEYKFWNVGVFTSSALESDKLYWLYARVPKTGTADGTFAVTTDERPFDTDPDYYNLLVGALNSEYDGDRSYSSLYGFTEVLPGQIVVNLIRSNDGQNYIDFLKNAVRIGNQNSFIDWNSLQDNIFRIRGAVVQSPSGAEDVIGVNRGTWMQNVTYYKGDEVLYNGATYRYVNSGSSAGVQPDLYPTYWQVRAAKGNDGRIFSYRGEYESGKSYTGNAQMAQVVKVGAQYYYTDANAGTFSGVQPPNANYWTSYGANFESVATGLLLAEKALIAGMFFDNNRMTSPAIDSSGEPLIIIDGNTGYVKLTGQSVLRVPFKNLGRELSGQINLTLDTHFNYSGSASSSTPSIVLPLGERYNGVQCMIFNDGIGTINNPARTINVSAQGGFVCMIGGEYVSTSSIVLKPYELGIFVCTGYTWIYINPNNRPRKTKEIIACGIVTGSSSGASISNSFTIDGSSISVSRLNAGQYRVYTGLASSTYSPLISLTGIGYVSGGTANPIKATLTDSTSTYFQVDTSDDDSRNDGSFMFQIFG